MNYVTGSFSLKMIKDTAEIFVKKITLEDAIRYLNEDDDWVFRLECKGEVEVAKQLFEDIPGVDEIVVNRDSIKLEEGDSLIVFMWNVRFEKDGLVNEVVYYYIEVLEIEEVE